LGIGWEGDADNFVFSDICLQLQNSEDVTCTKRGLLSMIARIFDPLGFMAPLVMLAKIIFQELWCLGLDWDEDVPLPQRDSIVAWVKGLENALQMRIPRCYNSSATWKETSEVLELHAFGDASEKGYGAVVYCKSPSD
jgi:hypothetical protein